MSIHANLSPEALLNLQRQKRKSTISSIVISALFIVLIALILGAFLLPNLVKETPVIVTYASTAIEDTELQEKKVKTTIKQKPSAPSSSISKVIAANTSSPTSIPVPDVDIGTPSLDFGSDDDFGSGWEAKDSLIGSGRATFFNQSVKGNRITYVIDFSASMRGKREELMRDELGKSVSGLKSGMQYQMIFFAGPAWVAGDTLKFDDDDPAGKKSLKAEISTAEGKKHEIAKKNKWVNPSNYRAEWQEASVENINASKRIIKSHELIYGTEWSKPLEMAMEMNPPPNIIFFMTDGTGGTVSKVKELASKAKQRKIIINSVAMMLPSAAEAMANLAHGTGGVFTIIDKNGRAEEVKPKEESAPSPNKN